MELEQSLKIYNDTRKILKAIEYVYYLNSWDIQTEAPSDSIEEKTVQMEFFTSLEYETKTDKKYLEAIDVLYNNREKLDNVLRHEITEIKNELEKVSRIPQEEYIGYSTLINTTYNKFVKAKNTGDFSIVKDYLHQIIDYKKKYIEWQGGKGYDILLDEYEKGSDMEMYDKFFETIKTNLLPLIREINKKRLDFNREILESEFDVDLQKKFSLYLRDILCIDKNRFAIKESEHPFTTNFTNRDVRTTNHYHSDMLKSAILSDMHEMGHALYELQVDDSLNDTFSGGGASMAMHESQSRFCENLIGRNFEFWNTNFNKLKEYFPVLNEVTTEDFYRYINESKSDFIRTEADELTYPIHVCIRYEIEKGVFDGRFNVADLPKIWNDYYREYLGIEVPDDSVGILQDVHWYGGDFGYFPTYALGTAYAVQILNAMKKDINVDEALNENNIKIIMEWLKEHIHKYGSSLDPQDILFNATGEKFNPDYYINYLVTKYKKLYNL